MKPYKLQDFLTEHCCDAPEKRSHTVLLEDAFLNKSALEQAGNRIAGSSLEKERALGLLIIRQLFLHLECFSISTLAHLKVGDRFELSDVVSLAVDIETSTAVMRLEALEKQANTEKFILRARLEERKET